MSHSRQTTNYELPLFEDNDKPSFRADFNEAMTKIDTNLNEVAEQAGSESAEIESLKNRVSSCETNITSNTEAINNEATRATNAENALNNRLSDEATRATNAETALDTKIDDETTRATAKENELETAITDETTRATNAETALDTKIDDETERATTKENELETAITDETTRATEAETALENELFFSDGPHELKGQIIAGAITEIGKVIQFMYPLNKRIKSTKNITLNKAIFYIRNQDGYIKTNDNTQLTTISLEAISNYATIEIKNMLNQINVIFNFNQQLKFNNGTLIQHSSMCQATMAEVEITIE